MYLIHFWDANSRFLRVISGFCHHLGAPKRGLNSPLGQRMRHSKIVGRGQLQKASPGSWVSIQAGGIGASVLLLDQDQDLDLDESCSAELSLSSGTVGYGILTLNPCPKAAG